MQAPWDNELRVDETSREEGFSLEYGNLSNFAYFYPNCL